MPPESAEAIAIQAGSAAGRQLGALLACFSGRTAAAKVRRTLEKQLRSGGNTVLDTTVLQINQAHKASVHDPHRVVAGALTSSMTWGVFGLLTGGVASLIASALLGAAWGGGAAYYAAHHATKAQLKRLGSQLPADSSALLTFAETSDVRTLLDIAAEQNPAAVSAAAIADDLSTRVFPKPSSNPGENPPDRARRAQDETGRLSMILLRYPDPAIAKQVASRIASSRQAANAPQVELVIETDRAGRRRVTDPKLGAAAIARYNVASWALLGLVCGAISGATGGGFIGLLHSGLVTGIAWGLFGLGAGALYGLWAGRAISARRLRGIAPILAPGTSTLLAWFEPPLSQDTTDIITPVAGTQRLILTFEPTDHGPILEQI